MKILTYNVHGWKCPDGGDNLAEVAEIIRSSGADIVGLNEVFRPREETNDDPLTTLAARVGMTHAFGGVQHGKDNPSRRAAFDYGNACLSRWPIVAYAAHHLPAGSAGGARVLLEARVVLPTGSHLTCYVTHLDHRSELHRLDQWKAAYSWLLRDQLRPHVLLGDFNALAEVDYGGDDAYSELVSLHSDRGWVAPEFELVRRVIDAGYVDTAEACVGGPKPTWPSSHPERRVDYIFLPERFQGALKECWTLRTEGSAAVSDHLPLMTEIDFGHRDHLPPASEMAS